jgi:hypothetical protein
MFVLKILQVLFTYLLKSNQVLKIFDLLAFVTSQLLVAG